MHLNLSTELLTTAEVARLVGVTIDGVHKKIKAGKLQCIRAGGKCVLVTRAEAEAWLRERKENFR